MLGIKTIAVLSGFLNKSKLLPYGADYIVNYSTEITEIINGKIQK
jgi:phosphoglycolate phosphatase-like HAD superfamily hydrolase